MGGQQCKYETWLKACTLPIHDSSIHLGEGLLHLPDGNDRSISPREWKGGNSHIKLMGVLVVTFRG